MDGNPRARSCSGSRVPRNCGFGLVLQALMQKCKARNRVRSPCICLIGFAVALLVSALSSTQSGFYLLGLSKAPLLFSRSTNIWQALLSENRELGELMREATRVLRLLELEICSEELQPVNCQTSAATDNR